MIEIFFCFVFLVVLFGVATCKIRNSLVSSDILYFSIITWSNRELEDALFHLNLFLLCILTYNLYMTNEMLDCRLVAPFRSLFISDIIKNINFENYILKKLPLELTIKKE